MSEDASSNKVRVISSGKQGIAGFIAGFTATTCTYPLDLIKTRFQSSHYNYNSGVSALSSIVRSNGLRGLTAGISVGMFGSSVAWGSYFYLYSHIKNQFRSSPDQKLSASQHLMSSFMAGAICQVITNPIWVLKTNLQLNQSTNLGENVRNIYGNRGLIGFWRGILPSMFGVCQASIHFMIYEDIKHRLQDRNGRFMTPTETIANTIFCKTVSVVLTYPYQVMRTRLQHIDGESQQLIPLWKSVWRQKGFRGFYAGISINITRIMPHTCITFLVFEQLKTRI